MITIKSKGASGKLAIYTLQTTLATNCVNTIPVGKPMHAQMKHII